MSVVLKICLPDKVFFEGKADKIILPVDEGTLTIIKDRAPRSQLLRQGCVILLDEDNKEIQKWHIDGGLADIAEDICNIAVTSIH